MIVNTVIIEFSLSFQQYFPLITSSPNKRLLPLAFSWFFPVTVAGFVLPSLVGFSSLQPNLKLGAGIPQGSVLGPPLSVLAE